LSSSKTLRLKCKRYNIYRCFKEEHTLRVAKKISGPKRVEVVGRWIKLHSEELHNIYASPDILRVIRYR
jgi:hypothetical protein